MWRKTPINSTSNFVLKYEWLLAYISQNIWCTVTVAQTKDYYAGHSLTPVRPRSDKVPRMSRHLFGQLYMPWISVHIKQIIIIKARQISIKRYSVCNRKWFNPKIFIFIHPKLNLSGDRLNKYLLIRFFWLPLGLHRTLRSIYTRVIHITTFDNRKKFQ